MLGFKLELGFEKKSFTSKEVVTECMLRHSNATVYPTETAGVLTV